MTAYERESSRSYAVGHFHWMGKCATGTSIRRRRMARGRRVATAVPPKR